MTIATDSPVPIRNGNASGQSGSSQKPHLVFTAAGAAGHSLPLIQIADAMVKRGYEASFVGADLFTEQLKRVGVEWLEPIEDQMKRINWEERNAVPLGMPQLLYDMRHGFIATARPNWEALKKHLEEVRAAKPGRQIIVVNETFFVGALPLTLGAPLLKGFDERPAVVSINVIPFFGTSIDTAPFGPGLPPDSTPSGRARNAMINMLMDDVVFAELRAHRAEMLAECGATGENVGGSLFNVFQNSYDVVLQMCPPSLEYPRSDLPPETHFAGALPPKKLPPGFQNPAWWGDLDGKKVVAVAQGTVAIDWNDMLVPTIQALADRDDIIVVAILCVRGATLPDTVKIPANTRVIDYLPYDAILPRADVFVLTAGYGGTLHSVVHGVPIVAGGDTEDKPEICTRIEWSGIGVSLKTGKPTPEQIRKGVDEVLADNKYKQRVLEIRAENEKLDPLGAVEEQIKRFTK